MTFFSQYIEAAERVYVSGCVQTILDTAESNLYIVGGVVVGLAIPQVSYYMQSNI